MPRATTSKTGGILSFFRTADLDIAALVLDLCKDEVSARRQKSAAARARAQAPPSSLVAPAKVRKAAGAKVGVKTRKPTRRRAPVQSRLPEMPEGDGVEQEADDLQPA